MQGIDDRHFLTQIVLQLHELSIIRLVVAEGEGGPALGKCRYGVLVSIAMQIEMQRKSSCI